MAFEPSWFAAAAFAPIVVWLLWRVQSIAINQGLRRGMYKLLRYQRKTYNVVSWMGVLLHELSHAFFLLIGGHGICNFKVGVDSGHVTPTQVRRGPLGLLSFLAAALAPMFVAPAIIFVVAWRWIDPALLTIASAGSGWALAWPVLRATGSEFPIGLLEVLVGLDVTTISGAVVFALAVFAMPSARPSYVARKRGEKDEGDIAVVRAKARKQPLTILAFFGLIFASYFVMIGWAPQVYWGVWQIAWATAMTAIVLAVLAGLGWAAVAWSGRIRWWAAWVPLAAAIGVQVFGRRDWAPELWIINLATIGIFALLALGLWQVAGRRY
jgi:hypothetical protein